MFAKRSLFAAALVAAGLFFACSGAPAEGGRDCAGACEHVASICGARPPGCAQACAGWTSAELDCVEGANDCNTANRCGEPSGVGGASSTTTTTGSGDTTTSTSTGSSGDLCDNGVSVGESICPFGGNTLKACRKTEQGVLVSTTIDCGGETPWCAAEVVNGVPFAACCPEGNVGDPHAPECKSYN